VSAAAEHQLIVIAGSIGVGKTSLATMMREHFGIPAWIEHADRNPHLGGLYEDPARWAYPAHEVFLEHALQRQREAGRAGGPAVVDRSPHETVLVFARMLNDMGYISPAQVSCLHERLDSASGELVQPSLLIYLHAPVDELLRRVRQRDWREERVMTADYLSALEAAYARFAREWTQTPLLDVDTAATDLRVVDNVERLLALAGVDPRS